MKKMKKAILVFFGSLFVMLFSGCGRSDGELPYLAIGYMFSNHQASLMVAAQMGELFADYGVYLREVLPRERYVLVVDGADAANIHTVVANNGGEVMTLMSQGHVQMALTSIGLPFGQIDQGEPMSILGPIHVDGVALIGANHLPVHDFDGFLDYVRGQNQPVHIGYHSPANAPVIIFEETMRYLGFTITRNPLDFDADILLINLRGTANLIPSLHSGEVVAWVGPSPFPELAILQGDGRLIIDLKYLPGGQWTDFPCCVFSVSDATLQEHRDIVVAFY
ncbi:MAG: ABC transporter substrate-binding protein, partial [Defluviitaleaceae bacterium]|nr:ABC transporter substrate-binding protein [Defluviitaleaceae bacterium]